MMKAMLSAAVLMLAGCSIRPDGSNGQRRNFDLPGVTYEQAYHRGTDYFQQCTRGWVGIAPNVVTSNLYPDTHTGTIILTNSGGLISARATMTPTDSGSHVTVVTITRPGMWNVKDLDAIQHAIQTGTITCR